MSHPRSHDPDGTVSMGWDIGTIEFSANSGFTTH